MQNYKDYIAVYEYGYAQENPGLVVEVDHIDRDALVRLIEKLGDIFDNQDTIVNESTNKVDFIAEKLQNFDIDCKILNYRWRELHL